MKIEVSSSFFESLKNLDSLKSRWYGFLGWFKYHFNKENHNLMKVCWKGRPWDCGFLYELEKAKLQEMITYHKKYKRYVGVEQDIKWMELCVNLIDIFTEKRHLFHYTGKTTFIPIEDSDSMEFNGSELKYHCDVNVNIRNAERFIPKGKDNPIRNYLIEHPHEIYIRKAKYLYHKIRLEKDDAWWD